MRDWRRAASMLVMPVPETLLVEPAVLVAYVNFAVAISMAQRLMESCQVTLSSATSALTSMARPAACDVVVLCPYLTPSERTLLLDACAAQKAPPAVLELCDEPGGDTAPVRVLSLPRVRRRSAQTVLTALFPTS